MFISLYFMVGIVLCISGVPLALRMLKPNKWFGVRTRRTLESSSRWYAINEFAGKQLIVWGLVLIGVGLLFGIFQLFGWWTNMQAEWRFYPLLLGIAIPVAKTFLLALKRR